MLNLDKIFGNLFATGIQASDLHFKNFIEDLLVRFAHYNTSGQYDTIINDLEALYTAFYGEITGKDIKLALQQSRTRSVDLLINKFKKRITVIYKTVTLKFPTTEPEYQEIFPLGANEFHDANKTNIETLLTRLKSFVNTHSGSFEAGFVTEMSGYLSQYNTARGVQLGVKEDVNDAVLTKAQSREKLELAVSMNLHKLAIEFIGQPDKGRAFYNQRLLFPARHNPRGGSETGEYVLAIPVGQKVKADFELRDEPDYYLLLANTGTEVIKGYTTDDINGIIGNATPFVIDSGKEVVMSYKQMGGYKYLFFFTDSPDTDGEVTIEETDAPTV